MSATQATVSSTPLPDGCDATADTLFDAGGNLAMASDAEGNEMVNAVADDAAKETKQPKLYNSVSHTKHYHRKVHDSHRRSVASAS